VSQPGGRRGLRPVRILAGAGVLALAAALAACSSSAGTTSAAAGATSGSASGTSAAAGTPSGSASGGSAAAAKPTGQLVVFAATSLTGAFDKIGAQFEKANPGVTVKFNYNGSSSLVTQIKQGAPADVFASANTSNMTAITDASLNSAAPQVFARNSGEIAVEAGNPQHVTSVSALANPALKVVVCAPEVPCGSLAQQIFKNAGVTVKPVSEEENVGGVVTKVSTGEADAGVVYVTDVKSAGNKVAGVAIPADQNETADYPIAQLKGAPNATAGAAFISYVLSPPGQQVLASFGFLPPK
jgi:molybdate transport system substrate-binding protein